MLVIVKTLPRLAKMLLDGQVVYMDTDTIPGIHALSASRLINIKGFGPKRMGYIMAVTDRVMAAQYAQLDLKHRIRPRVTYVAPSVTNNGTTVAFRVVNYTSTLGKMLLYLQRPIYSTSCNVFGQTPALSHIDAYQYFSDHIVYGPLSKNSSLKPSKIFSLISNKFIRK